MSYQKCCAPSAQNHRLVRNTRPESRASSDWILLGDNRTARLDKLDACAHIQRMLLGSNSQWHRVCRLHQLRKKYTWNYTLNIRIVKLKVCKIVPIERLSWKASGSTVSPSVLPRNIIRHVAGLVDCQVVCGTHVVPQPSSIIHHQPASHRQPSVTCVTSISIHQPSNHQQDGHVPPWRQTPCIGPAELRSINWLRAETQMANGDATTLLGIVLEVGLAWQPAAMGRWTCFFWLFFTCPTWSRVALNW